MNAHTPGPWTVTAETWWVAAKTGQPICMVDYALVEKYEAMANARLIALAPELAALLRELDAAGVFDVPDAFSVKARAALSRLSEETVKGAP